MNGRCASLLLLAAAFAAASCSGRPAPESAVSTAAALPTPPTFAPPADRISLVAEVGRPLPHDPDTIVTALGIPTADRAGRLSFTGSVEAAGGEDGFVWQDGRVRWRNSRATEAVLRGAAPQVASAEPGRFLYRTQVDGEEGLWSHNGLVLRRNDEAPGFGAGSRVLLQRRPRMLAGGATFWIAEVRDARGPRGRARVLYSSSLGADAEIRAVLRSDDEVGGYPLARPNGLDLAYDVSADAEHRAHVVHVVDPDQAVRQAVLVDDQLRLIQDGVAGGRERWERFFAVAVDSDGNYLASADTDSDVDRDLVVVFNGEVVAREGDRIAGFTLRPPAKAHALALDADGRAAQIWSVGGVGEEVVLYACDPASPDDGFVLFETRERIDLDGDGVADAFVERLSDLGHGDLLTGLGRDHFYVAVMLERDGEAMHEAILSVPIPGCASDLSRPTVESQTGAGDDGY